MTHEHWSIEDGLQLQALMTSLQLDDWQIAQANALSVHQVRELLLGVPVGKSSNFLFRANQSPCGAADVGAAWWGD